MEALRTKQDQVVPEMRPTSTETEISGQPNAAPKIGFLRKPYSWVGFSRQHNFPLCECGRLLKVIADSASQSSFLVEQCLLFASPKLHVLMSEEAGRTQLHQANGT